MKHLKHSETDDALPKVGDYANVIGTNEIGIINDINVGFGNYKYDKATYVIEYDEILNFGDSHNIIEYDDYYEYIAYINEFYYSKTKEKLEIIIQANKFNI
jgi:hypothetical protein